MSIERDIRINVTSKDAATGVLGKLEKSLKRVAAGYLSLRGAQKAIEFVQVGASLQAAEYRLAKFAGGAEEAATYLESLNAGADGTIDRLTGLAQASRMLETHMVQTADQMGLAGAIVAKLGNQTWTTERRMQSLTMLLANQSIRRLDDFGLSVENVRRRQKELEKQGLETEQAFKTAVFDEARVAIAMLGDTSELATTKLARTEASFKDTKNAVAAMATELLTASGILDGVSSWATSVSTVTREIREHGFSIRSWAEAYKVYWQSGRDTSAAVEQFTKNLEKNNAAQREQARQMDILTNSYFGIENATERVIADTSHWQQDEEELRRSLEETNAALRRQDKGISEADAAMLEYEESLNAVIEATPSYTALAERMAKAMRDQREAAADLVTTQARLLETLTDISKATLASVTMDRLTESFEAGRISQEDYEKAMFAVQVQMGLIDADAMVLRDNMDTLIGKFEGGEISAYDFATGLEAARTKTAELVKGLKSIPKDVSSTIRIKTIKETIHKYSPDATIPEITRQHGGPVLGGQPYLVGEAGPEIIIPHASGQVYNTQQAKALAGGLGAGIQHPGGKGDTYIEVTVQGNVLDDRTAWKIADKIARAQRLRGIRRF